MFHIGIGIGGTFTDCVLIGADAGGQVMAYRTAEALSTPADPADGVPENAYHRCGRQSRKKPPRGPSSGSVAA